MVRWRLVETALLRGMHVRAHLALWLVLSCWLLKHVGDPGEALRVAYVLCKAGRWRHALLLHLLIRKECVVVWVRRKPRWSPLAARWALRFGQAVLAASLHDAGVVEEAWRGSDVLARFLGWLVAALLLSVLKGLIWHEPWRRWRSPRLLRVSLGFGRLVQE